MNFKAFVAGSILGAVTALVVLFAQGYLAPFINPVIEEEVDRSLEVYAYPTLRKTDFEPSDIEIADNLPNESNVITKQIFFTVHEKKVSGVLNIPQNSGEYPIVLMFRGFVDKSIYRPGIGTQRAAEFFARNGYITISPDFLGYGESDQESFDSFEARFQTYTTALTLLESVEKLNTSLEESDLGVTIDTSKIAIWGHSNGGQIAISALEISGKTLPTTLWAPVTEKFPDSILHYADEFDDGGEYLRGITADFLQKYNPQYYSPPQYLKWIQAPIIIHQGTADEAIPTEWSDQFVEKMEDLNKNITYHVYPGEDHNFSQGAWAEVVRRDLDFFETELK